MEYRHLGKCGLKVSEIAYGTWTARGSSAAQAIAEQCIYAALEMGITTFDTADVYTRGRAEEILGKALGSVRRESVVISTKVYWPVGDGPNDRGLSRKHVTESLHASLRRLNTDYIDLYQAHRYDHETPLAETLRAFDDLVRAGKVLYVGVSEWRAEEITAALRIADQMGFDRIVSVQAQYNMLWRVVEPEVLPLCAAEGLGHLAFSPVAQGALAGKYLPSAAPPPDSRARDLVGSQLIARWLNDPVLTAVQRLAPLADEAGLSLAQLAVAWTLQNPGVSTAIVGASRPEQLRENVAAAGVTLGDDLMRRIDATLAGTAERDPGRTASPRPRP